MFASTYKHTHAKTKHIATICLYVRVLVSFFICCVPPASVAAAAVLISTINMRVHSLCLRSINRLIRNFHCIAYDSYKMNYSLWSFIHSIHACIASNAHIIHVQYNFYNRNFSKWMKQRRFPVTWIFILYQFQWKNYCLNLLEQMNECCSRTRFIWGREGNLNRRNLVFGNTESLLTFIECFFHVDCFIRPKNWEIYSFHSTTFLLRYVHSIVFCHNLFYSTLWRSSSKGRVSECMRERENEKKYEWKRTLDIELNEMNYRISRGKCFEYL